MRRSPMLVVKYPCKLGIISHVWLYLCRKSIFNYRRMYIFNTTYHVDDVLKDDFIAWLRDTYIPAATARPELHRPQLCRVLTGEETEGERYSLQFHVADNACLETWYTAVGAELDMAIQERYGERVIGFNTLLEVLE